MSFTLFIIKTLIATYPIANLLNNKVFLQIMQQQVDDKKNL